MQWLQIPIEQHKLKIAVKSCQQNHTKTLLNKIKITIFPAAMLSSMI